jgi:uncharacterized protein
MAAVAVSGSSGLIGTVLVEELIRRGHQVRRMVRRAPGPKEIFWDPAGGRLDPADLEGLDGVVHLAGENVGARWTQSRKIRIRESRVNGTRLISEAIARLPQRPAVLVSASAIGIYGSRGDQVLTELSPPADPRQDFLASVALDWEAAAEPARVAGIRVVNPRFGFVLSPKGGGLKKMLPPFRLGLGGPIGTGTQWLSWISIEDTVGAILHALFTDALEGPVNTTAPEPITNREFTRTLGRVLRRPTLFPVPGPLLRLALGEMADGTLLASARVVPTKLLKSGYRFRYPGLETALRHMLGEETPSNFPP